MRSVNQKAYQFWAIPPFNREKGSKAWQVRFCSLKNEEATAWVLYLTITIPKSHPFKMQITPVATYWLMWINLPVLPTTTRLHIATLCVVLLYSPAVPEASSYTTHSLLVVLLKEGIIHVGGVCVCRAAAFPCAHMCADHTHSPWDQAPPLPL